MKKKCLAFLLSGLMLLLLPGCGDGQKAAPPADAAPAVETPDPAPEAQAPDLTGSWVDAEYAENETGWRAIISDGVIEVYLQTVGDDGSVTPALYWAGTFVPPSDASEPYEWESQNDTERTSGALFGSSAPVKAFKYQDGLISFEATMLGNTVTGKLKRGEWSYDADALTSAIFGGASASDNGETMIASGDLGAYHVEIKDAAIVHDYDGNPSIVITYSWTNNSEDTTSAMMSILEKAFQDGVELDRAMIFDSSLYDSGASSKDVRPGTTIDVQCAFTLTSETSTVEFELSEAFSWTNSDIVTMDFNPSELGIG